MKKKLIALASALILLMMSLPVSFAEEASLSFNGNGEFTILQLSDMQDDAFPAGEMLNLIRTSIKFSSPDLIVITGDLVEDSRVGDRGSDSQPLFEGVNVSNIKGELNYEKTRENVEKAVDAILTEIENFEIPYVIALGNNDRKVGLSSEDWIEILSAYKHCVIFDESEDAQGGIDYHVTIKGSDGSNKFNVWLMDTCRSGISDEQVDWYKALSKEITAQNGGSPVPALAFQHIQTSDMGNLFEECSALDEGARKVSGGYVRLNKEIANGYNFWGYKPGQTSYEFEAWKECGDVIGAFFGHQHVEGFSGVWDGIELGFTYGSEMAKTGPYGFRVFTLHENDITNYENSLYRYEGNSRLGNVTVTPEAYEPYKTYSDPVSETIAKIKNLASSIISAIIYFFSNL
ncbi:MAG: metallophosphoesterase [Oscillospiraceae bacterium]|nr:metallophosphoesterase [Oscillospiraceae bacterium]